MQKYRIQFKDKIKNVLLVKDYNNSVLYVAKRTSNKTEIRDGNDNVVAEIKRQISLIVPKYKIQMNDATSFSIKRRIGFCVAYDIEGKPWEVLTDSSSDKYLLMGENQKTICEIIKERRNGSIEYVVNVLSDENSLTGVCVTIAVDSAMRAISRV